MSATVRAPPLSLDALFRPAAVAVVGAWSTSTGVSDVVKALALGSRACLIGGPLPWGLAVAGEDGVHRVLEILRNEIDQAFAFCGRTDVRSVRRDLIHHT